MKIEQTVGRAVFESAAFHGRTGEFHIIVRPTEPGSFEQQLDWVIQAYRDGVEDLGIGMNSAVLRRFFVSDPANQARALEARAESNPESPDTPCAISWIGQPPAPPARVALWAYHVSDPRGLDKELSNGTLTLTRGEMAHRWTVGLTSCESGPGEQTREILGQYDDELGAWGSTLADNVLRTWFFVRDIDVNYHEFVAARREFFAAHGLTAQTHYIASSGIEGRAPDPRASITLDAWAVSGIRPEQIKYLAALDHLSPTHRYGVTFERGTAVGWRDRRHVIISGTASIDAGGNILHPGDVEKQCGRTLENIEALLKQAGAAMADMKMMVVYVRDTADFELARKLVGERVGDTPFVVVLAPVCRPGWLIEIEGLAIVAADNPGMAEF
ncbi:MAG: Rid family hydrolase [Candidatus Sumerlaeia bacterium]